MPTLDVTDILSDPDIAGEAFTVRRRVDGVDENGLTVITYQSFTAFGCLFPQGSPGVGADVLDRRDDFQFMSKTIKVITPFRLQGPSQGFQPDTVIFGGNEFIVQQLDDFTHYGAGFVQAQCMSMDTMDNPPE